MAKTFSETLDELVGQIERAIEQIAAAPDQTGFHQVSGLLRSALIDLLVLLERDPGIEMAVADLYCAAETLSSENTQPKLPHPRRLRLIRDASARFRQRLGRARPSAYGTNVVWRSAEPRALAS